MKERERRVGIANKFLVAISSHGRRFFEHEGRVSHFKLDMRGRIWFVDKYSEHCIYTHQPGYWGRHFSDGGTLQELCIHLREYIMGREELPMRALGPWRKDLCGGDLWGYGDAMQAVRDECGALCP